VGEKGLLWTLRRRGELGATFLRLIARSLLIIPTEQSRVHTTEHRARNQSAEKSDNPESLMALKASISHVLYIFVLPEG
jgi:uncharacterized membrane-anchored protein